MSCCPAAGETRRWATFNFALEKFVGKQTCETEVYSRRDPVCTDFEHADTIDKLLGLIEQALEEDADVVAGDADRIVTQLQEAGYALLEGAGERIQELLEDDSGSS